MIKQYADKQLAKLSTPAKWLITIGAVVIILILLWFYGAAALNHVGNYFFHRKVEQAQAQVQKQLDAAAAQKKVLEQTLLDLKKAKDDLAIATKAREEAEKNFNDRSKTAVEKVNAYKAVMSDAPVHTDTTGITTSDLCERAKAAGSDPATVSALCGG